MIIALYQKKLNLKIRYLTTPSTKIYLLNWIIFKWASPNSASKFRQPQNQPQNKSIMMI